MLSININNVLKLLMINVIGNTWVLCNLFLSPIMAEFEYVCPTYPESEKYEKCEFSKKTYKIPKDRPVRIYVDGIYDLLHYGHMLNFKQAKELFENVYLIVGVCDDELTHKYKGQTVQTHEERLESVRHVRYVDQVVEHAPWSIDQEFIDKHKIDYVAHDDAPYIWNKAQAYKAENTEEREATDSSDSEEVTAQVFDPNDVYYYVKSNGMFIPTVRARNVSTSGIITKIIKNYDQFVMRNLERGATAKELNVGPFKELDLKVKKLFGEELGKTKEEILLAMKFWESRSSDFLKLYGENVDKIKAAIANKKDDLNTHGFLGTCEKVVKKLRNGNMDEVKKDQ